MPQSHLDATDIRILEAIQTNGRLSNVDLANRIGLSPSACLRRVQALENEGYVRGYSAQLNPKKVGLGVTAVVMVTIAQDNEEQMDAFRRRMIALPEVLFCLAVTGVADYILRVVAPDLEAFERFVVRDLLKTPGVKDVRSHFVIGTVKDNVGLPLTYAEGAHH
ncbi:MAG TPA: Lrp/AsnC family transcriptional regulator [Alphaproteobacteria bacterium]|nr:Lrp/AsnC family transcriptional regulator [Alphaproteobacteria bacterium]